MVFVIIREGNFCMCLSQGGNIVTMADHKYTSFIRLDFIVPNRIISHHDVCIIHASGCICTVHPDTYTRTASSIHTMISLAR